MGGFQAITAGLGSTGEEMAQGENNALNEALKVRAQLHQEQMDTSHLTLAQAAQQQTYQLAQQQHELVRQQMLDQGWTHTGTVKDPKTGQYYQQFDNPRMPLGQQTARIPYGGEGGGVPPDSMEAMLDNYKRLKEQGFEDTRAQQLAFKSVNLYRTDPAGLLGEYGKYAKELNEEKGVTKVPVFGFGTMDISTEEGRAKYAQAMIDSGRGMGPLLRSMMGYGTGKERDMTGWTANEQREFKALESEVNRNIQGIEKLAGIYGQSTFMPGASLDSMQQVFDRMNQMTKPYTDQLESKYAEINGRHGRTGEGGSPQKGAYKIGNVWYDATTHQPIPMMSPAPKQ